MTDIQFIIPLATEIQNKQGWPLHIYINKYINKKLIPSEIKIKKNFHDNDHRYVFRNPYSDFTYDENDLKMEALMTDFISNFVIYGNPSTNTILWPTNTDSSPFLHLNIDLNDTKVEDTFPLERIKFWKEMVETFPIYDVILGKSLEEEEKASSSVDSIKQCHFIFNFLLPVIMLFSLY
uniref:Carboxylesterase type B domain-containing protein n=1 Tax=Meloidogyne enterolobii TaxID=390850 RepID=A0A6V7TUR2_MELEN|nr:unnamed protein product [Meloidogyne enterolobii]